MKPAMRGSAARREDAVQVGAVGEDAGDISDRRAWDRSRHTEVIGWPSGEWRRRRLGRSSADERRLRPRPVRLCALGGCSMRTVRVPAAAPARTSASLSPTIHEAARSISWRRAASSSIPAAGLRHSHRVPRSGSLPSGWCQQIGTRRIGLPRPRSGRGTCLNRLELGERHLPLGRRGLVGGAHEQETRGREAARCRRARPATGDTSATRSGDSGAPASDRGRARSVPRRGRGRPLADRSPRRGGLTDSQWPCLAPAPDGIPAHARRPPGSDSTSGVRSSAVARSRSRRRQPRPASHRAPRQLRRSTCRSRRRARSR